MRYFFVGDSSFGNQIVNVRSVVGAATRFNNWLYAQLAVIKPVYVTIVQLRLVDNLAIRYVVHQVGNRVHRPIAKAGLRVVQAQYERAAAVEFVTDGVGQFSLGYSLVKG